MLRDVRSNVTDGLLGFATATGDGLHIKIGVSPSVTEKPITILGSMGASTIKSKLGLSPLADAVMDAVQGGAARVFCIPVAASTAGTIGEVTKTGDGGGSVTVQGSPNNAYALTVRFTAQGGLNTAAFVYSIDGDNFSEEITVPVTGSYEIEGTGLTIKFTEASSPDQKPSSFLVRDTYTLKTTAPSMTNGDVLGAIEKIKSFSEEFEFVHIVGGSTVELWEAVSEAQKELMTVCHKPCFFLMEAAYPADEADGDLSDWALQMEADLPEHYEKYMDAFRFIEDVALDWEESRYLLAEPGDYIVVARKAKDTGEWFVGGVTDENRRTVTLPFDYLDPGKEYVATLYADAPDADYQTNPQAYVIRTGKVRQRTELDVEMARGGGFAISIREATDADRKLCKLK